MPFSTDSRTLRSKHPMVCLAALLVLLVLISNVPLWQHVEAWQTSNSVVQHIRLFSLLFFLAYGLTALLTALLTLLFGWRAGLLMLLTFSLPVAYFMQHYGIVVDKDMLINVAQTDWQETRELVAGHNLLVLLLIAAIIVLLVHRFPAPTGPWWRQRLRYLGAGAGALVFTLFTVLAGYQTLAPFARNHREIQYFITPLNLVRAGWQWSKEQWRSTPVLRVIGDDAVVLHRVTERPRVLVLVVGETARADHFALNAYPRDTTPQLLALPVLSFHHVQSCGTATAVSVPCMFSRLTRDEFSLAAATQEYNLLDVLQTAGIQVQWRENQSGCKGVCARVADVRHVAALSEQQCENADCFDERLLDQLEVTLAAQQQDTVVVLHMLGSHGPTYAHRYPASAEFFQPACHHNDLSACDQQALINVYDNTIRYTDHVLAETIRLLQRLDATHDTAMIYLSDHGESLGEHNIYLHGLPYAFAPDAQTHVPLIIWLSNAFARHRGVSNDCLRTRLDEPLNHDYLFHSVLSLMNVQTREYRRQLDWFSPCLSGNANWVEKPASGATITSHRGAP